MTNNELSNRLSELKNGDKTAFEEIYRDISACAYTVAYRITGDRHLSEDILQDFFVKLYKNPPAEKLENPKAYLMRMVHNITVDYLKKQVPDSDISDNEAVVLGQTEQSDEKMDIACALKRLDSDERKIVTLHLNAGFKFREISGIISMPLGTVLWKYRRAIGKLRNYLNGGEK